MLIPANLDSGRQPTRRSKSRAARETGPGEKVQAEAVDVGMGVGGSLFVCTPSRAPSRTPPSHPGASRRGGCYVPLLFMQRICGHRGPMTVTSRTGRSLASGNHRLITVMELSSFPAVVFGFLCSRSGRTQIAESRSNACTHVGPLPSTLCPRVD